MPRCSGYTAKRTKCKIVCKGKYCRHHCKTQRTGGGIGKEIMTKPDYFNSKQKGTKYGGGIGKEIMTKPDYFNSKQKGAKYGGALFKKKEKSTYQPKIDLDKYPQVLIEQKKQKHLKQLVGENKANQFCAMSDVRPGQAGYAVKENKNGLVAIISGEIVGFLLFTPKKRGKMSGGNYMYLELICTSKTSKKRKDKRGKNIPVGTLLLTKFEQIARQLGYYKLKGESVKEAVKFYKRNGWTVGSDKQHKMTKKIY